MCAHIKFDNSNEIFQWLTSDDWRVCLVHIIAQKVTRYKTAMTGESHKILKDMGSQLSAADASNAYSFPAAHNNATLSTYLCPVSHVCVCVCVCQLDATHLCIAATSINMHAIAIEGCIFVALSHTISIVIILSGNWNVILLSLSLINAHSRKFPLAINTGLSQRK